MLPTITRQPRNSDDPLGLNRKWQFRTVGAMGCNIFHIAALLCVMLTVSSCEGEEGELLILSDAFIDPVVVTLAGDLGTIETLETESDLTADQINEIRNMLVQGIIDVLVKNDETGATVRLIQGTQVPGLPIGPGQYTIEKVGSTGRLNIVFFNGFANVSLQKNGAYSALITVNANTQLEPESFARTVFVR